MSKGSETTPDQLLKRIYEEEIGEPWDELEKRTRERHKTLFKMLDAMEDKS